jgi:hypothetical protein
MSDTGRGSGRDRGPDRDRLGDEEFRAVVEDLTVTLRDLKHELEREQERRTRDRRGLFGLPRPPSGEQLLRFADEFAIPAAITILEANVELLKHLRRAIRTAERTRETRERTREAGEQAVDAGQDLLQRVGDGLGDLRSALEGETIPEDAAGEDLLAEVRDLQAEIDSRVDDARTRSERSRRRRDRDESTAREDDAERDRDEPAAPEDDAEPAGDGRPDDRDGDADEAATKIDVDAELESLRERYRDEGSDAEGDRPAAGDDDDAGDDADAEA